MLKKALLASMLTVFAAAPAFAGWTNCGSGVEIKQISVRNKNDVWGVSYQNKVYRFNGRSWKKTSLSAKQVSVAKDGSIAILSANNLITVKSARGAITPVTGTLAQISRAHGGNGGMWGVNSRNEVYAYNAPNWSRLTGFLRHVSVGKDTTVWGVNSKGDAYLWGTNTGQWAQKSNGLNLAEISCASSSKVWAVSSTGSVYRYNGSRLVPVSGKLAHIGVGYDGTVYGVTGRGQLVLYSTKPTPRPTPRPTPKPKPAPATVQKVRVSVGVRSLLVGQSTVVRATAIDNYGKPCATGRFGYSADRGKMEGANFIATAPGRVTIRVTHYPSRVSGTAVITVREPLVCKRIVLKAAQNRVFCGGRVKLSCSAFDQFNKPFNAATEFTVRGVGGSVKNGVFYAGQQAGRAEIIVFNRQYRVSTKCVIEVVEPIRLSALTFENQVSRIRCGESIELKIQGWDQYLNPCRVRRKRLKFSCAGGQLSRNGKTFSSSKAGRYKIVVTDPSNRELVAFAYVYVSP